MNRRVSWISISVLLAARLAAADVLEMRDGRVLEGAFRGGTQQTVRFEIAGSVQVVPVRDVLAVTFDAKSPAAPTLQQGSTPGLTGHTAEDPPATRGWRVPAGTLLRVRIADTVDPRIGAEGDRFAGLLETPIVAGEATLAPIKTRVYGVVSAASTSGPVAGRLKLELTELMLGAKLVRVVSGTHQVLELPHSAEGEAPAKAAGAAARPDRIPSGSLLEFRLLQPLEIRAD